MAFGVRLRELREAAGLTQAQLAERAGVPLGTLRDYEQARRREDPSLRMAARLAAVLGVPIDELVAALDDPGRAERAQPAASAPPPATPAPDTIDAPLPLPSGERRQERPSGRARAGGRARPSSARGA